MPHSVEYEHLQVKVLHLRLMERLHHCQGLTAHSGFATGCASTESFVDGYYPFNGLSDQDCRRVVRVKPLSALAALACTAVI
jgi:hypothetical protein